MRKKGGELLGQGGYACAFYPSINCADGSKNGGISKIFKDIFSYEDELFQLIKVARYDTEAKYSNPMVKSCKVKYEAIQDIDKNKCIWMNGEMAQDDNYQIIYKHKGIDFEKYLKTRKYSFRDIVNHLVEFAEGIAFFNGKNYTHLDIKAPNMLITDTDNRPILIDFGLSIDTNKIYNEKNTFVLNSEYPYYPPEFRIHMMHQNEMRTGGLRNREEEYDEHKPEHIGIYTTLDKKNETNGIGTQIYNRMCKDYDETLKAIREKLIENKITKIIQFNKAYNDEFASKVDVFSFGIVILTTMHTLSKKNSNQLLNRCKKIGEDASHINPYKRININQVVQQLKILLEDSKKYSDATPSASLSVTPFATPIWSPKENPSATPFATPIWSPKTSPKKTEKTPIKKTSPKKTEKTPIKKTSPKKTEKGN
jgi:serine/threonine protein kinase